MRVLPLATVAVLLVLTSCSNDDSGAASDGPAAAATSTSPGTRSLAETCPEIEAGLPKGVVPPASAWSEYAEKLRTLSDEGDIETQNAIGVLLPAVEDLAGDPENGLPLLDARDALYTALDTMADRCAAVGSSALQ